MVGRTIGAAPCAATDRLHQERSSRGRPSSSPRASCRPRLTTRLLVDLRDDVPGRRRAAIGPPPRATARRRSAACRRRAGSSVWSYSFRGFRLRAAVAVCAFVQRARERIADLGDAARRTSRIEAIAAEPMQRVLGVQHTASAVFKQPPDRPPDGRALVMQPIEIERSRRPARH